MSSETKETNHFKPKKLFLKRNQNVMLAASSACQTKCNANSSQCQKSILTLFNNVVKTDQNCFLTGNRLSNEHLNGLLFMCQKHQRPRLTSQTKIVFSF